MSPFTNGIDILDGRLGILRTRISLPFSLSQNDTTDASGITTYSYDSLDRLTMKATPEGTLNYTL